MKGTSGYLSEWALSGRLVDQTDRTGRTLAGAVALTHTGVCSQDGPEEKVGEMRAKIVGSRLSTKIVGVMSMNGAECSFSGSLNGTFSGAMDCPDAKGVPVTFEMERAREIPSAPGR